MVKFHQNTTSGLREVAFTRISDIWMHKGNTFKCPSPFSDGGKKKPYDLVTNGHHSPFNEEVQQLLGATERPVGSQEGAHKLGVGVHVVREPLHQLDQSAALDERTLARARRGVLKHNVVL